MTDTTNLPFAIGSRAWMVRRAGHEITLQMVKVTGYGFTAAGGHVMVDWEDEEGDGRQATVAAARLIPDRADDMGTHAMATGLECALRDSIRDTRLVVTADPKRVGEFKSRTPTFFRDDSPDYQDAMAAEWPEFLTYDPDVGLEFTRLGELVREGRA